MSSRPTITSSLLDDNNDNFQTYTDDLSSIQVHKQSQSIAKSSKSSKSCKSSFSSATSINNTNNNQYIPNLNATTEPNIHSTTYSSKVSECEVCIGAVLNKCEKMGCIPRIKKLYHWILYTSIIVAMLLILSRIFDNKLFGSYQIETIFVSNSPPLLLSANIIMMISYSIETFLTLRICLAVGCLFFTLWGLTNNPILLDTAMFNTVMFLFNINHSIKLSYHRRHISFETSLEQIYVAVFEGYLNRVDFKKLVDISYKRDIKKGEIFKRKGDEVTSLCCLVNGRISVIKQESKNFDDTEKISRNSTNLIHAANNENNENNDIETFLQNPQFVNLCHSNQFIEAPQWVASNLHPKGHRFTVSFKAVDDCEYIKWPKENLINLIDKNQRIYHALSGILGLHTAHALLKSREYQKYKELSIYESITNNTQIND